MKTLAEEIAGEITEDCATWGDPRVAELGISHRKLDHYCRMGYLQPLGGAHPGSGRVRRFSVSELEVAKRMVALMDLGFIPAAAADLARDERFRFRTALAIVAVGDL